MARQTELVECIVSKLTTATLKYAENVSDVQKLPTSLFHTDFSSEYDPFGQSD